MSASLLPQSRWRGDGPGRSRAFQGLLALLWLSILLAGCIKVDETMTLAPDGSGTLDLVYGMPEQMVAQMQAVQAIAERMKTQNGGARPERGAGDAGSDTELGLEFDPQVLRRAFQHYEGQGVHLEQVDSELREGWRFTHLKVRFAHLDGLLHTELFKDRNLSLERLPDGNYRLALSGNRAQRPPRPEAKSLEHEPATAEMLKGFHVATAVNVPGRIVETNAHQHSAARAEWVYDIAEDPNALTRMGEEHPYIVFEGKGLTLPRVSPEPRPANLPQSHPEPHPGGIPSDRPSDSDHPGGGLPSNQQP